ncbi:MAG: hypothetical protein AAF039_02265, partial [Bacteroidota bacterium]
MKKTLLRCGLAVFVIILTSCNQETTLQFNFLAETSEKYTLYAITENVFQEYTAQDSAHQIQIEKGTIFTITNNSEDHYVYVLPGDEIVIDTLNKKPLILGASGKVSPENEFLNSYIKTFKKL